MTGQETRTHTVFRHVGQYVRATGTSWPSLATEVRERYEGRTPAAQRRIGWSNLKDAYDRARLDAQTLRRFEDETAHGLPADLEEAIVYALPPAWRQRLRHDLFARYEALDVRIPDTSGGRDAADYGTLAREFGEAAEAIAQLLADDGRIGPSDRTLAPEALRQVDDLVAAALAFRARLEAVL